MAETWLVAYDNSPCAAAALEVAARDAPRYDAGLVILHVLRDLPPVTGYDWFGPGGSMVGWAELSREIESSARAELDRVVAKCKRDFPEVPVTPMIRVGAAPTEICHTAAELGVARVFIGTHGRGLIGGLLFGSVAERVLRTCVAPVVVVKAEAVAEAA